MRTLLAEPPPEEAEVYLTMRWVRIFGDDPRPLLKVWRGRQQKPRYYRFTSIDSMNAWLNQEKRVEDFADQKNAVKKRQDRERLQEQLDQIQIGTLLHNSWGYDQTNCDFYQVVDKKGRTVVLREIMSETVPGSEGFMSDKRVPVRDAFTGEPFNKVITKYGVQMKYGSTSITRDDEAHCCSWYA